MPEYRLTAHEFDRADYDHDSIGISLTTKAETRVVAATFTVLEYSIGAFGKLYAPCVVWVGCVTKPKPRGFNKWDHANGATKWLFEAPAEAGFTRDQAAIANATLAANRLGSAIDPAIAHAEAGYAPDAIDSHGELHCLTSEALSYGVRCTTCGEYETACTCNYDPAIDYTRINPAVLDALGIPQED